MLSQPLGHTCSKRLLQVGDHLNFRVASSSSSSSSPPPPWSLDAAFQELSAHPGFAGAVWLGDIYETECVR